MKRYKIIYQIIILIITGLIRNGIMITQNNETILQIHGIIIRTCFIGEILHELLKLLYQKYLKQ